jgi:hypothetical protein
MYPLTNLPSCYLTRASTERLLLDIRHFLNTLESPHITDLAAKHRFLLQAAKYFVSPDTGHMYRRNGKLPPLRVIFDPATRLDILTQAHEDLGHRKLEATYETLRRRVFWPHLRADIQHHVNSCHECQIRSLKRKEVPVTVLVPTTIFSKLYIDVMFMPKAQGYKFIMAARDDLTGVCEAQALKSCTARTLSTFFWKYIYCRYGVPLQVTTDNGSEVKAGFGELMKRMSVPHVKISPYNKHANGVVERGHFTLREALVKACRGRITHWPDLLAEVVFADRVTVSKVTGFSPYQLLHATDPILPFDLTEATFLVEGFRSRLSTAELLALHARQLGRHEEDIKKAAETLKAARFKSKEQFERRFIKKLQKEHYKSGELVLLRNTRVEASLNRKTQPRYLGPFEVGRKTRGGAYELLELDGTPYPLNNVAAFRLLPYISRDHWFMKRGWLGDDEEDE